MYVHIYIVLRGVSLKEMCINLYEDFTRDLNTDLVLKRLALTWFIHRDLRNILRKI